MEYSQMTLPSICSLILILKMETLKVSCFIGTKNTAFMNVSLKPDLKLYILNGPLQHVIKIIVNSSRFNANVMQVRALWWKR